jgi:hypothetical protein
VADADMLITLEFLTLRAAEDRRHATGLLALWTAIVASLRLPQR